MKTTGFWGSPALVAQGDSHLVELWQLRRLKIMCIVGFTLAGRKNLKIQTKHQASLILQMASYFVFALGIQWDGFKRLLKYMGHWSYALRVESRQAAESPGEWPMVFGWRETTRSFFACQKELANKVPLPCEQPVWRLLPSAKSRTAPPGWVTGFDEYQFA